jgi:NAD(P)-dependent dehydrogenase (short-subunit alcohol dehydrogenase family)
LVGRFEGRVAVVTGAAGQIGGACARAFAAEGADVAAIDLTEARVESGPGRVVPIAADLSDPGEIERAFDAVEADLGAVDVLVQSAAVHARVPFLEIDAANIDHVLGINVRAILLGARRAAASMVQRDAPGVIVNLTSVSGVVSDAESIAYEASKGAVTMATRGMAVALAPHGIRVVAVGPGSMAKFQELPPRDPRDLDDYERRRIPLGRLGRPEDIAESVLFVASPAAAYVTGTVLYVDGGSLAAW